MCICMDVYICMYGCLYVYLHNICGSYIATNISGYALWSCARINMRYAEMRRAPRHATPVEMHEAHSMHASVERLFTNTGYK